MLIRNTLLTLLCCLSLTTLFGQKKTKEATQFVHLDKNKAGKKGKYYYTKGFHIGGLAAFNYSAIIRQNNYQTLKPIQNAIVRESDLAYRLTWGFDLGGEIGYNFKEHWGILSQIMLNKGGQHYQDNFDGPALVNGRQYPAGAHNINVKRNVDLTFIQVPMLAKYMSSKGSRVKYYINFGFQFDVLLTAAENIKYQNITYIPDSFAFSPRQKFRNGNLGFAFGSGVEIFLARRLYMDLGFNTNLGLLDINSAKLQQTNWYSKNRTSYKSSYNFKAGLMISVHYIFASKYINSYN